MTSHDAARVLREGAVEVLGLLPYSSNYTFLVRVDELNAVYKPVRGERPLWDFPTGTLAAREAAAFVVSSLGGFELVPPTVLRDDAPLGPGSLQLFVEHDPQRHFFVLRDEGRDFRDMAAFDVVINNADRKSGHVIEDGEGRMWSVDHGVSFHAEPKLRTVIWDYADERVPDDVLDKVSALEAALRSEVGAGLSKLLSPAEVTALGGRISGLMEGGRFPLPDGDRPYPWPLV